MDFGLFVQLLVNGLLLGAIYGLVALGLTLILSILDSINFAHGDMFMLGGVVIYAFFAQFAVKQLHLPLIPTYLLSMVLAMGLVGLLGVVIEIGIFHPFIGKHLQGVILTLGLGLVIQTVTLMGLGTVDKGVPSPFPGIVSWLGASVALERIVAGILAVGLVIGLWYYIHGTKVGLAMRAISQDREAAALQGIHMRRICAIGFGLGCALAAAAGVLMAPIAFVNPFVGEAWLMKSFIIIIVGGMGSIPGSLLAGFLLGLIESFGSFFFSIHTATVLSFSLVIVMLLLRPRGLLGHA